jgi:hypothetical protein
VVIAIGAGPRSARYTPTAAITARMPTTMGCLHHGRFLLLILEGATR